MKIAIIVTLFPPTQIGGLEIATYNIAKCLAKKGHKVHIITSLSKGLPKETMENGFFIHRLFWRRMKNLGYFIFWVKILFEVKKINPDIVHVQGMWTSICGYLAKEFLKIPYVLYARGSDVYRPEISLKLILRTMLKNADAVIALTEDMKKNIQKTYNREVFVIPNGIDLEKFVNISRKNLLLSNYTKKILFVGRLHPVKGVRYLIEAMKIIKEKDLYAKLIIVGDGEEREKLQKLANKMGLLDSITFTGQIPNQNVSQYMAMSDILVLPSLSEGFPNVILEAMAFGIPIVATNVGGVIEIMENGVNGFLVKPGNPDQIAQKVLFLFNNKDMIKMISNNNKKLVKQQHNWEKIAIKLENVYLKCLKNVISIKICS